MVNSIANWMTVATTAEEPLAKYDPGMATRKTKSTSRVQKNTLSFPQLGGFGPDVLPNGTGATLLVRRPGPRAIGPGGYYTEPASGWEV